MSWLTPARLAKLGLALFAPVEVMRLAGGSTLLGAWTVPVTWLGQALIIIGAVWAAMTWTGRPRLARALLGLWFLMALVWPWFTLYEWDAGGVSTARLLQGIDPAPFIARAGGEAVKVEYLSLVNGVRATFPSSPSGCVVPTSAQGHLAIVSAIDVTAHSLIWAATLVGGALCLVGAGIAAWHLYGFARSPADRAWVIAAAAVAVVIGGLLVSDTAASLVGGCTPPSPERTTYRLYVWTGIRLHPFGPALLALAGFLFWYWPRRIAAFDRRATSSRLRFRGDGGR